jgi:hypothetical protein
VLYRIRRTRERNAKLVRLAKSRALKSSGRLACAACGFDFARSYGSVGEGYIECHHTLPLSQSGRVWRMSHCLFNLSPNGPSSKAAAERRPDLQSAFLIHSLGAFSNMTDREIRYSQRTGARDCLQPVKRPSNVLKRLEPPLHSFWVTAADSNYHAFFFTERIFALAQSDAHSRECPFRA